jgi:hypothetical protein
MKSAYPALALCLLLSCEPMYPPLPASDLVSYCTVRNNPTMSSGTVQAYFVNVTKIEIWNYGDRIKEPIFTQEISLAPFQEAAITIPEGVHYVRVYTDAGITDYSSANNFVAGRSYGIDFCGFYEVVGTRAYFDCILLTAITAEE